MTRDELDAATDEQLNEMAAKVIYGITPRWVRGLGTDEMVLIHSDNPFLIDGMCTVDELRKHAMPKSPATDIADAWELVEKMRVLYGFNLDASGFDGAEWRVVIGWGDDPISVHVEAATAPRAITTAALLAWEAKEKA